ncbi:hypothetical protein [Nocardia asiatica]|uniref:hypothetical protein n=1 Tax=Nocardia asiatica TaxID=209252 RepID=UPI003EE0E842
MTRAETNEVTATVRQVDPRVVVTLCRAAELAAERGQWLRAEHLIAALVEGLPGEASLFETWWPRDGAAEPDPYNGYNRGEPDAVLHALSLPELVDLARQMLPPAAPARSDTDLPAVDYTVAGPDGEAFRTLIEGSVPSVLDSPRRYADYEPEQQ